MHRNAIKRAANPVRACRWSETDRGCGRCSHCEGVRDAIADARRSYRSGQRPTEHPDPPDYFGVRLSDSVNGTRYLDAYDATIALILRRFHVSH